MSSSTRSAARAAESSPALRIAARAGYAANGVVQDAEGTAKKWGQRVSEWGQGVVFLALAFVAASVALGARPHGDSSAEDASRGVLSIPGGPWVLGAVGVGVAIGGIAFVWMGIARS